MAKELSANPELTNGLVRNQASASSGFKAAITRWLSAVIHARQRTAMDQISRFDPDLARLIREVQDPKSNAD